VLMVSLSPGGFDSSRVTDHLIAPLDSWYKPFRGEAADVLLGTILGYRQDRSALKKKLVRDWQGSHSGRACKERHNCAYLYAQIRGHW